MTTLGCLLIVITERWHSRWSQDSCEGIQKFHNAASPRIAGLAIYIGLIACDYFSPPAVSQLLGPILLAGLPAFIFGFAEDLTKQVTIRERFLATLVSGLLATWLTGISLKHVGVWGLDDLLAWLPFSLVFTAFAISGVINAVNIIDGFNGLASGVVVVGLAAMGYCAYRVGDSALAQSCLLLAVTIGGFMLVNFPYGKIFLGDGGAYLLGFWLGWVAVLLPMRNPSVSPWASLLACSYPILEVLFSIARRYRRRRHLGHPDRLHLHSLIQTRVIRKHLMSLDPALRNSAVSPIVWGFAGVPALLAILFHNDERILIACTLGSAIAYALAYRRLVRFGWFKSSPGATVGQFHKEPGRI